MRIVFLDIDGVLNKGSGHILPEKVKILNQLSGICSIVVSSAWRHAGMDIVMADLKKAGFNGKVVGATSIDFNSRATQIKEWLDNNPKTKSFAILDDNDLGECKGFNYAPHFVKTVASVGLTQQDVEKVKSIL